MHQSVENAVRKPRTATFYVHIAAKRATGKLRPRSALCNPDGVSRSIIQILRVPLGKSAAWF